MSFKKIIKYAVSLGIITTTIPSFTCFAEEVKKEDPKPQIQTINSQLLKDVEVYLNSISSLTADFSQFHSTQQDVDRGQIYIRRPGMMRIEYKTSPLLIIADGQWLINYDRQLKQPSSTPLDNTPADFLLRSTIQFGQDMKVAQTEENNNEVKITCTYAKDPQVGQVVMNFKKIDSSMKFELIRWVAYSPKGSKTEFNLSNVRYNLPLGNELFKIK